LFSCFHCIISVLALFYLLKKLSNSLQKGDYVGQHVHIYINRHSTVMFVVEKRSRSTLSKASTMKTLAVACFLAVVGIASCQNYQCLNCNSTLNSMCGDPLTTANNQSLITQALTCTATNGASCIKYNYASGGASTVIRQCGAAGTPSACIGGTVWGYGGSTCNCYGNYCNAGRPSVVPTMFTSTFLVAVAFMLAKLGA